MEPDNGCPGCGTIDAVHDTKCWYIKRQRPGVCYTIEDVTDEIRRAAESIYDGWYAEAPRIDWEDFLYRLEGMTLKDGTVLDLGDDMTSRAIQTIKAHIRMYRRQ